jgi:7,8-dihydro-6-hydroxymethylpterin-pyrophosphokinase
MTEIPGEGRVGRGEEEFQKVENDTGRESLDGDLARKIDPDISEFDDEALDGTPINRDPE